jgi:hypothetical protein
VPQAPVLVPGGHLSTCPQRTGEPRLPMLLCIAPTMQNAHALHCLAALRSYLSSRRSRSRPHQRTPAQLGEQLSRCGVVSAAVSILGTLAAPVRSSFGVCRACFDSRTPQLAPLAHIAQQPSRTGLPPSSSSIWACAPHASGAPCVQPPTQQQRMMSHCVHGAPGLCAST